MEEVGGPGYEIAAVKDIRISVVPSPVQKSDTRNIVRQIHENAQQTNCNVSSGSTLQLKLGDSYHGVIIERAIWKGR